MKKFFILIVLLFIMNGAKAQVFVTIPDSVFAQWLQTNVPSAMNGNQMDTTNISVDTLTTMNLLAAPVSNLYGIQFFNSLQKLYCFGTYLTNLNNLPQSLKVIVCTDLNLQNGITDLPDSLQYLECSFGNLTGLPALPNNLKYLYCSNNFISNLPNLPNGLLELKCNQNHLTGLPTLPSSLIKLECFMNDITNIPTLSPGLKELNCSSNQISSLPSLPTTLIKLYCSSNNLTNLPALPGQLEYFYCDQNSISSIPIFPASLRYINCGSNQLSTIPILPNSLIFLSCYSNNLSVIPTLPITLIYLDCGNNNLSVLPALPTGIKELSCYSNHLTSIPALHDSLTSLLCSDNNLTSLPNLPLVLKWLKCSSNQLTSLPNLPPHLQCLYCENNQISCFPPFPQSSEPYSLYINGNPFTCLPNYMWWMSNDLLAYPLCSSGDIINNPYNCSGLGGVVGYIYKDIDADCSFDATDPKISNIHVMMYDSINNLVAQTYSLSNGAYSLQEITGTYTVKIDTAGMPFHIQCTNPGIDSTVVLTGVAPTANVSFPVVCNSTFDVGVQSVFHESQIFPGQNFTLFTNAGDMSAWNNLNCGIGISGQVMITVNGPVSYIGIAQGSLTPTIAGNVFTYTISDFGNINNPKPFGLVFSTDTSATTAQQLCVTVSVTPLLGDYDTINNNYSICFDVSNSWDPNFKEVSPVNVPPAYNGDFTYTLHFQNIGTASAINVNLADTIDANLDVSTFRVLSYSHPNSVLLTGHILKVFFTNIQLPDSTSNPEGSSGYIQYAIKPIANLPEFSQIKNTAWIYFDYNAPIATNTTTNVFTTASIEEPDDNLLINIYPNPTSDVLNITGLKSAAMAEIFDVNGKMLIKKQLIAARIDISELAKGMYFIKISNTEGCAFKKFVKK